MRHDDEDEGDDDDDDDDDDDGRSMRIDWRLEIGEIGVLEAAFIRSQFRLSQCRL